MNIKLENLNKQNCLEDLSNKLNDIVKIEDKMILFNLFCDLSKKTFVCKRCNRKFNPPNKACRTCNSCSYIYQCSYCHKYYIANRIINNDIHFCSNNCRCANTNKKEWKKMSEEDKRSKIKSLNDSCEKWRYSLSKEEQSARSMANILKMNYEDLLKMDKNELHELYSKQNSKIMTNFWANLPLEERDFLWRNLTDEQRKARYQPMLDAYKEMINSLDPRTRKLICLSRFLQCNYKELEELSDEDINKRFYDFNLKNANIRKNTIRETFINILSKEFNNIFIMDYEYKIENFKNIQLNQIDKIDSLMKIPGVWSKETENGIVLDVSQTKDIGKEMLFSLRCFKNNKNKTDSQLKKSQLGTRKKYRDMWEISNGLIVFKVIATDIVDKIEREYLEAKYALEHNAQFWNPAPNQFINLITLSDLLD